MEKILKELKKNEGVITVTIDPNLSKKFEENYSKFNKD